MHVPSGWVNFSYSSMRIGRAHCSFPPHSSGFSMRKIENKSLHCAHIRSALTGDSMCNEESLFLNCPTSSRLQLCKQARSFAPGKEKKKMNETMREAVSVYRAPECPPEQTSSVSWCAKIADSCLLIFISNRMEKRDSTLKRDTDIVLRLSLVATGGGNKAHIHLFGP